MTPESAIGTLDEMLKRLNAIRAHLADESEEIGEMWERMGAIGAQRADHAAQLLGKLRPHLAELSRFAGACDKQIATFQSDPFGVKS